MTRKINILGAEYDYSELSSVDATPRHHEGYSGEHAGYDKTIKIYSGKPFEGTTEAGTIECKKSVVRHEIVHGFLFQSGMTDWVQDEKLTEWIAMQFPKMLAVFKEVDAL